MKKKIKNIKFIRLAKLIQISLILFSVYFSAVGLGYVGAIPLIVAMGLELFMPRKYGWGLGAEKTAFFHNDKVLVETLLILLFLAVMTGFILHFIR